jgi:hypothetical protein
MEIIKIVRVGVEGIAYFNMQVVSATRNSAGGAQR